MKRVFTLGLTGCALVALSGCGTTPIHAVFLSNEKNIWVEEPSGGGLSYCLSNSEGSRPEPTCYSAKRGHGPEKAERSSSQGSSESAHSQKEPTKSP